MSDQQQPSLRGLAEAISGLQNEGDCHDLLRKPRNDEFRSPNFSERNAEISMLVMHYTGMKNAQEALDRLCDEKAQVSAHYVVDEDGTIYNLVDEEKCAWHAGVSYWRGNKNVNNISIGVEIVNLGHEFGYKSFPKVQMQAVLELSLEIVRRYNIAKYNVVGHSDIAPQRKADPGELFDWQFLADNGVGLWYDRKNINNEKLEKNWNEVTSDQVGAQPAWCMKAIKSLGYDITDEKAAIIAFQRHFRQSNIDGVWDAECQAIIDNLLGSC